MITAVSTIIAAVVVSLVTFWKLALISMSSLVALLLVIGAASRFIGIYSARCLEAHAQSSQVAEETLSAIQVVKALGAAGPKLVDRFEDHLKRAVDAGRKSKVALGALIGGVMAIAMLNVGLGLWQGSRYIIASETSPGAVSTIILSMLIGTFTLVTLAPIIGTIASGLAAASKIFALIEDDRLSPPVQQRDEARVLRPEDFHGSIEFRNITFQYPSRPKSTVLRNVSLVIPAGKVTAFVGASGSGKSTFVNLLQRFYEPAEGAILVDGHDIGKIDVHWLRQQMALVDQEPVLFSDTILYNIAVGLTGSERSAAGMTDVETTNAVKGAASQAGLHEFISSLPWGYQTVLHEGGTSLSGGQRQRIAISRALIRDPKILLLDEASSALDAKSERHIQDVIDSGARDRRTTLVIAHRLSTVRDADNIVVMAGGQVMEQGTHEELCELQGHYYALLNAQQPHYAGDRSAEDEDTQNMESYEDDHLAHEPEHRSPETKDIVVTSESFQPDMPIGDIELVPINHHQRDSRQFTQADSLASLVRFVTQMNRQQLLWTILGLAASFVAGSGTPIHVFFLSHGITTISLPLFAKDKIKDDISLWAGMYIMLAAVLLLANLLHSWALGLSSERLMFKAKTQAFKVFINKELSFFDSEGVSTGALVSFLSTEPAALGGISGPILGMLVSVCTTITVSVAIAIGFGWKLGLVATATVPVLLVSGFLRLHLLARIEQKTKTVFEKAMSRACESIAAIRTVASLTLEEAILSKYQKELNVQRMSHVLSVSVLYSMSFSLFFFCMALIMWYGTNLLADRAYTVLQLWLCFVEIMFSTQSAGALFAFAPDLAKAKEAAQRLKNLLRHHEDASNKQDEHGGFDGTQKTAVVTRSGDVAALHGRLEFQGVEFAYPSRPRHRVLQGLSFTVEPGQFVAIVGPSGSGKSTIISLLERFYKPLAGSIRADGGSIGSLDVATYRSQMALVNQDICLFQGTIRENILLGLVPGQPPPSEEELLACCKAANIHELVSSLP